jgi:Subtilase family
MTRAEGRRWLFGEPLADPRDQDRVVRDRGSLCGQLANLGTRQTDPDYQRHLIDLLLARRAGDDRALRIGVVGEPGQETLISWGELLLRAEDSEDTWAAAVLRRIGLRPEPVDCLKGKVVRWSNPEVPPERLDRVARRLRSRGLAASVNHIAPLAPIAKGLGGPEPTSVRVGYAATARQGSGSVVVAVVDTGVTDQKRTDGWLGAVARDTDTIDRLDDVPAGGDGFLDYGAGHGTFAAGVVAQVAPEAEIRVYRALDTEGVGSEVEVACAMVRAVEAGADVVNLSLGTRTRDDVPPVAMTAALEIIAERSRATGKEVLLVAAAGNFGDTRPCWPAAFRQVVSVAGLSAQQDPADWSSHGFWVDCSTVGEGIVSTYVEGRESPELDTQPDAFGPDPWALWSGTSFAAPQVSGAVARLREDGSPSVRHALVDLLAKGRPVPGYGMAVGILPGT